MRTGMEGEWKGEGGSRREERPGKGEGELNLDICLRVPSYATVYIVSFCLIVNTTNT